MSNVVIITGDDILLPNTIIKDGVVVPIALSAVVTCRLVSLDQSKAYCSPVVQVSTEGGADWPNGIVVVNLPSANTLEVLDDADIDWKKGVLPAKLETQIDDYEQKIIEMDAALEEDFEGVSSDPNFFNNYKATKLKAEQLMEAWEALEEKIENCF